MEMKQCRIYIKANGNAFNKKRQFEYLFNGLFSNGIGRIQEKKWCKRSETIKELGRTSAKMKKNKP